MQIQVDARMLRAGGIGRYIREVTGPWLSDQRVSSVRFLGRPEELEPWLAGVDGNECASIQEWRDGPYSPLAQLRWLRLRGEGKSPQDVSFFPHYDVPLMAHPQPSVVTVHDLTQYRLPGHFSWWKRKPGQVLLKGALAKAARILTVSEHAKSDLCALTPRARAKIQVVPNGVASAFRPLMEEEVAGAEERFRDLKPYLMAMGDSRPHKNLPWILRMAEEVRKERPDLKLVLVGSGDSAPGAFPPSGGSALQLDWIHWVQHPSDDELRELYALSHAFLFPSLYEGFGLPPLEAAASGAFVLSSDRASLPEVLGDRAVLLDPEDQGGWVRAVLEGPREASGREGALPTWEAASAATLDALIQAASSLA